MTRLLRRPLRDSQRAVDCAAVTTATAAGLDLLRAFDWLVLHDVRLTAGAQQVDITSETTIVVSHVLAGPAGVFLVASACGPDAAAKADDDIAWAAEHHAAVITNLRRAARALSTQLGGAVVTPVLCLEQYDAVEGTVGEVLVLSAENILATVSGSPAVRGAAWPSDVARVVTRVDRRSRFATRPRHRASADPLLANAG